LFKSHRQLIDQNPGIRASPDKKSVLFEGLLAKSLFFRGFQKTVRPSIHRLKKFEALKKNSAETAEFAFKGIFFER
jgi:hypothetical protein